MNKAQCGYFSFADSEASGCRLEATPLTSEWKTVLYFLRKKPRLLGFRRAILDFTTKSVVIRLPVAVKV